MKKRSYKNLSGAKRWTGVALIIVAALVFLLSCIPSFLNIGNFFLGVFGVMIYPLCVMLALIGAALMMGLRYTFDKHYTAYIIIASVALISLIHIICSSKALSENYKTFAEFGKYLGATYSLSGGATVGGLLISILVYLVRASLGVGGGYVIFSIIATLFIGLILDRIFTSKRRKEKLLKKQENYRELIDDNSGISTDEYSFKNNNFRTFKEFDEQNNSASEPLSEEVKQDLFSSDLNVDYSFNDANEDEQKTQNDAKESAKSVLFGANLGQETENDEEKASEEPKSAHDILFGSKPEVPNIFDRSSEERDAWRREYASHTLGFSDEPKESQQSDFDGDDNGDAVKTSWGEYRPTRPLNQNSSIDEVDRGRLGSDRASDRSSDRLLDGRDRLNSDRMDRGSDTDNRFGAAAQNRNIFDRGDESSSVRTRDINLRRDQTISRDFSGETFGSTDRMGDRASDRINDRSSDRLDGRVNDRMADRSSERLSDRAGEARERMGRERTSLSNFNRETAEQEPQGEFGSRLNERRGADILANASSLGVEAKPNLGGSFSSITSRGAERETREVKPQPRENFASQLNKKYTPPPTTLLQLYKEDKEDYSEEYKQKSEILESTLSAFKIPAKVINVVRGPKVTRYELTMPTGIPVTKILSYERDMSMNLASRSGVRIEAPIPGKSAFGVEVENAKSSMVGLRELVEAPEFVNFKAPLAVAIGKNISGEVIVKSLSRMVHLLVAGSTGSGKSVFLHALIMSLMYKYSPEELRFIMIDPKRVEFPRYNGMPHLMLPEVVNECSKAVNALNWAVKEMERRYELLMNNRCQKIEAFNECAAVKSGEEKKLPYLVIVIDELAELMSAAKKDVEGKIQRITQLGRAAGIHMVVATQRPSVDVITGVIKNNLPTRVALSLSSAIDSMTVINQGGAEKLLGHGDMLLSAQDSNQIVRLQGAFVSDEEIDKTLDFIKAHNACVYDEEVQKLIYAEPEKNEDGEGDGEGGGNGDKEMDELMPQALKLVMKNGKASISMIQRRFSVGYARAARIIDQMETHGFIDAGLNNKPRDIKITVDQYNELFGNFDGE